MTAFQLRQDNWLWISLAAKSGWRHWEEIMLILSKGLSHFTLSLLSQSFKGISPAEVIFRCTGCCQLAPFFRSIEIVTNLNAKMLLISVCIKNVLLRLFLCVCWIIDCLWSQCESLCGMWPEFWHRTKNGHARPRFIICGLCQTCTVIWKGQSSSKRFKSVHSRKIYLDRWKLKTGKQEHKQRLSLH